MISCFIKIKIGLTSLVPAYPGCPGKEAIDCVSCLICLSFWFVAVVVLVMVSLVSDLPGKNVSETNYFHVKLVVKRKLSQVTGLAACVS